MSDFLWYAKRHAAQVLQEVEQGCPNFDYTHPISQRVTSQRRLQNW